MPWHTSRLSLQLTISSLMLLSPHTRWISNNLCKYMASQYIMHGFLVFIILCVKVDACKITPCTIPKMTGFRRLFVLYNLKTATFFGFSIWFKSHFHLGPIPPVYIHSYTRTHAHIIKSWNHDIHTFFVCRRDLIPNSKLVRVSRQSTQKYHVKCLCV